MMNFDPVFNTDRFTSALITFKGGSASFLCGMQINQDQRAQIYDGRSKLRLAFPLTMPTRFKEKLRLLRMGKPTLIFLSLAINMNCKLQRSAMPFEKTKKFPSPF